MYLSFLKHYRYRPITIKLPFVILTVCFIIVFYLSLVLSKLFKNFYKNLKLNVFFKARTR